MPRKARVIGALVHIRIRAVKRRKQQEKDDRAFQNPGIRLMLLQPVHWNTPFVTIQKSFFIITSFYGRYK